MEIAGKCSNDQTQELLKLLPNLRSGEFILLREDKPTHYEMRRLLSNHFTVNMMDIPNSKIYEFRITTDSKIFRTYFKQASIQQVRNYVERCGFRVK